MIKVKNENYNKTVFTANDYYVMTIGYETRGYKFFEKNKSFISKSNSLVFLIKGYDQNDKVSNRVKLLEKEGYSFERVNYTDYSLFISKIYEWIKTIIRLCDEEKTIHIDYSSMPRNWYCRLPLELLNYTKHKIRICFWYAEGSYSKESSYPSAGLSGFSFFAGNPSLTIDKKRYHLISVGLDGIRTQAVVSIVDPEFLVVCYAYNPADISMRNAIEKTNRFILKQSAMQIRLPINDFEFMYSKLKETILDLSELGDTIIIPDGPKPLIIALSLLSQTIKDRGVSCLQLIRNLDEAKPVFVDPGDGFCGFSIIDE